MDYSMSYPRSSIFHKVFYANYQFIHIDTTSELYTVNSVCLYTYYTLSAIQIAILMKKNSWWAAKSTVHLSQVWQYMLALTVPLFSPEGTTVALL